MKVVFGNCEDVQRLDRDADFDGAYERAEADEIRHRLQILRSAKSEQRLFSLKALSLQPLGTGKSTYLIRVTDQLGMEVEFDGDAEKSERSVVVNRITSTYNDKKGEFS